MRELDETLDEYPSNEIIFDFENGVFYINDTDYTTELLNKLNIYNLDEISGIMVE